MITPEFLLAAPLVQQLTSWLLSLPYLNRVPGIVVSWVVAAVLASVLLALGIDSESPLLLDLILLGGSSNLYHEFRKIAEK